MMAVRTYVDDGIGIGLDDEAGNRPRGCQWDESVCTATPEYRIQLGGHDHEHDPDPAPEVRLACGRHYALELARLVEVHLPGCSHGAAAHVTECGPVGG